MVTNNNYAQTTKADADNYAADIKKSAEDQANAMLADAQTRAANMLKTPKPRPTNWSVRQQCWRGQKPAELLTTPTTTPRRFASKPRRT